MQSVFKLCMVLLFFLYWTTTNDPVCLHQQCKYGSSNGLDSGRPYFTLVLAVSTKHLDTSVGAVTDVQTPVAVGTHPMGKHRGVIAHAPFQPISLHIVGEHISSVVRSDDQLLVSVLHQGYVNDEPGLAVDYAPAGEGPRGDDAAVQPAHLASIHGAVGVQHGAWRRLHDARRIV